MREVRVEHAASAARIADVGCASWPIWTKEVSVFRWTYDEDETCLFLEGDVIVTPDGGTAVRVGQGDLVTFPAGMSCTWDVKSPVRKHYRFG